MPKKKQAPEKDRPSEIKLEIRSLPLPTDMASRLALIYDRAIQRYEENQKKKAGK